MRRDLVVSPILQVENTGSEVDVIRRVMLGLLFVFGACSPSPEKMHTPDMPGDLSEMTFAPEMSEPQDMAVEPRPDILAPPTQVILEPEQLVVGVDVESFVQVPTPTFTLDQVPICQEAWVWETEDPEVATVEGGRMSVRGVGVTRVTARCGAFQGSAWFAVAPVGQDRVPEMRIWLTPEHGVEVDEDGRVTSWRNFAPVGGRFELVSGTTGATLVEIEPDGDEDVRSGRAMRFEGSSRYRYVDAMGTPGVLEFEAFELWMAGRRRSADPGSWFEGEGGEAIRYGAPGHWNMGAPSTWTGTMWPDWESETLDLQAAFTLAVWSIEDSERPMFAGKSFASVQTNPYRPSDGRTGFTDPFVREGPWGVTRLGDGLNADVVEILGVGRVGLPRPRAPNQRDYMRARLWVPVQ